MVKSFNDNKNIFMCHNNIEPLRYSAHLWKELNPEWKIWIFDDNLCRKFIYQYFGKIGLQVFDYMKSGPIKADFWRCCILYKFGGLYVDSDIEPVLPLRRLITPDDYFISCLSHEFAGQSENFFMKPGLTFNPHFIYCRHSGCGILRKSINMYIEKYLKKEKFSYWPWSIVENWRKNWEMQVLAVYLKRLNTKSLKLGNRKYKFLVEEMQHNSGRPGALHGYACTYNNEIFMWNRSVHYDSHNHQFKSSYPNIVLDKLIDKNQKLIEESKKSEPKKSEPKKSNPNKNVKINKPKNLNVVKRPRIIIIDNRTYKQNPGFRSNKIQMNVSGMNAKRLEYIS